MVTQHTLTKYGVVMEMDKGISTATQLTAFPNITTSPSEELVKFSPEGKSSSSDSYVLLESEVLHLVLHSGGGNSQLTVDKPLLWPSYIAHTIPVSVKVVRTFSLVRLDASDVVRRALGQPVHQGVGLALRPGWRVEGDTVRVEGDMVREEGDTVRVEGDTVRVEGGMMREEGEMMREEGDMVRVEGDMVRVEGGMMREEGDMVRMEGDSM